MNFLFVVVKCCLYLFVYFRFIDLFDYVLVFVESGFHFLVIDGSDIIVCDFMCDDFYVFVFLKLVLYFIIGF